MKKLLIISLFLLISGQALSQMAEVNNSKDFVQQNSSKPTVTTTIAPIYYLVKMVAQEEINIELIININDDPHHYHQKPSDAQKIQNSALVFLIDRQFESFIKNSPKNIEFAKNPKIELLKFRKNTLNIETHHHCHHHENSHDFHIWLSTKNAIIMLEEIANNLKKIDPTNAKIYEKNAIIAKSEINQLALKIGKDLKKNIDKSKAYLVFHDAYQYFEKEFNLPKSASIMNSNAQNKTIKEITDLQKYITQNNIKCLFHDRQFEISKINFINNKNQIKKSLLDPIWAYHHNKIDMSHKGYIKLMENLSKQLISCLH